MTTRPHRKLVAPNPLPYPTLPQKKPKNTINQPLTGKAVRLIVEDGLEAYLPLADMVDAAKEKERLGKQAAKLQGEIEVRHAICIGCAVVRVYMYIYVCM